MDEYEIDLDHGKDWGDVLVPILKRRRETSEQEPSPATIFSLFYKGKFITTNISICLDSRYDKLMEKANALI